MIFSALVVKFLSAGAVAQAATGATVAVVAFTGVGAVGALPGPVQDTFATVVSEITPLQPPASGEPTEDLAPEEDAPEVTVSEEVGTTEDIAADVEETEDRDAQFSAWALKGPDEGEAFSAWVGEGSKEDVKAWLRERGMSFGDVVSRWASGKEFSAEEFEALGGEVEKTVVEPAEQDTDVVVVDEPETESAEAVTEDKGSRGKGSNGNGNPNSDKGKGNGKN